MDASIWAFLLLAIGIVCLIAEVFIPSGGIIAVIAACSLIGAVVCAGNAWWSSRPVYFWSFISGLVVLLPIVVAGAFYVWPSTALGKRAILDAPAPEDVASFVEQEEKYRQMLGKPGETLTMLNPAGIVRIDGHRVHCQSEGVIIETGVLVKVITVQANRVIVRRVTGETAPETKSRSAASDPAGTPLDFDMA